MNRATMLIEKMSVPLSVPPRVGHRVGQTAYANTLGSGTDKVFTPRSGGTDIPQ